jgi:biofilm PGA synthesis N-glycosyltransferase PgaC
MGKLSTYVLITPARDEAQFIELTIQSVIAQTVRPVKWLIVSDGSTDGTDDIVKKYMAEHPWIELVRMPERRERNFAGKAYAFNAGYAKVKELEYEVIGNLDGDLSFDADYFSFLLQKMSEDPALGVVGTPFTENGKETFYDYSIVGLDHVSGACQLFRRQCFEEIGGYIPMKLGGVDHVALTTARMKGWKTRTFTEKTCLHHRKIGTAQAGVLKARYKVGVKDYVFGGHPLWEVFRAAYQMTKRPLIVGGVALGAGYLVAAARREERPIPREMVAFRRREQMLRLKSFLTGNRTSPDLNFQHSRRSAPVNSVPTIGGSTESCELIDPRVDSIREPLGSRVVPTETSRDTSNPGGNSQRRTGEGPQTGVLIINADDWGRNHETTERTLECILRGTVSSVSAMVFMEDSERAAEITRERGIDAGLHLNLTTPYSAPGTPAQLIAHQQRISRYLRRHRLAQAIFHPGLVRSFEYVVRAQLDEFRRLYRAEPDRIDGHHHMHICANVVWRGLLPAGTIVRRNFSFWPGEKKWGNRFYRKTLDRKLARRHRLADFFFSLQSLRSLNTLDRAFSLAREFAVEVETHPSNLEEYRFLMGDEILRRLGDIQVARCYAVGPRTP